MMIQGSSLPPFIHPPCALNEGLHEKCIPGAPHHCLPEILAICTSLVHMFYTRTAASSAFVWKTIYAEQLRLCREHDKYSSEALLAALQAMGIYVLLQAQDSASIEKNDALSLITTTHVRMIALRLHETVDYGSNFRARDCVARGDWIQRESIRRTYCLFHIIELLLDVLVGSADAKKCGGFLTVPLPCVRELWEPVSNTDWGARYQRWTSSSGWEEPLTVGDMARATKTHDRLMDLATWCEEIDEYGTLLWMARGLQIPNL
ncbi:hypothetical protein NKR23_g9571 [Pleurostoma richardsiae]|uniref:Transcription factor domain-containing protein n=1 Tax=Pleurostoma richardsiae TaxID=41990 RepID=A0AA38VMY6_9PEZI|nr:hypothetical protein NKR23_g9571 [Pleurostoma richardsiae]